MPKSTFSSMTAKEAMMVRAKTVQRTDVRSASCSPSHVLAEFSPLPHPSPPQLKFRDAIPQNLAHKFDETYTESSPQRMCLETVRSSATDTESLLSSLSTPHQSMASTPTDSRVQSPRTHHEESSDAESTNSESSWHMRCTSESRSRPVSAFARMENAFGSLKVQEEERSGYDVIFSRARHGRYREVQEILESGCPVDLRDDKGNTALHAACQGGSMKTVKVLLRKGCKVDVQNAAGNTPLHYCYAYKYVEIGEYLMRKCQANPNIINRMGCNAFEGLGNKVGLPPQ
uniref:Uncharacterized protein n=1 Tax=Hanusia phi TaxID=3032 RepID=A0A7S0HPE7_9CRYP|mmetsp:Transcript_31396/g.70643  ORF Transcript_31396/g.70643 Transcript_31396/m.70643 type:complete len:287 (+) Transcript_31396:414-1274(+)